MIENLLLNLRINKSKKNNNNKNIKNSDKTKEEEANNAKYQNLLKSKKYKGFLLPIKYIISFLVNLFEYISNGINNNNNIDNNNNNNNESCEILLNMILFSNKKIDVFYEKFKLIILFLFEIKFDIKIINSLINIILEITMILVNKDIKKKKKKNSIIMTFAKQIMCIPGLYHINPSMFVTENELNSKSKSVSPSPSSPRNNIKKELSILWDKYLLELIINDIKNNNGNMLQIKGKYYEIPYSAWFISNVACLIQCIDSMQRSQFVK